MSYREYVREKLDGIATFVDYTEHEDSYTVRKPADSWSYLIDEDGNNGQKQETLTDFCRSVYQTFNGNIEILSMSEEGNNYGSVYTVKFLLSEYEDGDEIPSDEQHYRSDLGRAVTEYESAIYRDGFMPTNSIRFHRIEILANKYSVDINLLSDHIQENDILFRHNLRCMDIARIDNMKESKS